MCLALPARIVSLDAETDTAIVAIGEVRKEISVALVEGVGVDDYVLVHVGYALNRIDEEEARKTLELFAQAGLLEGGGT